MNRARSLTDSAGQITDLVDFGDACCQATGWGSHVGNGGRRGDATLGIDQYARNDDPSVGSWLESCQAPNVVWPVLDFAAREELNPSGMFDRGLGGTSD